MATKKAASESKGESAVVSITDEGGRVHYTARNSPTYDRLIEAGGTPEDVTDEAPEAGPDATPDAS